VPRALDSVDGDISCIPAGAARGGESAAHRELKRLSLIWAQSRGFRIAAAEVSLPSHRYRLDVAACRVERAGRADRSKPLPALTTAIFECKASREDFRRDARSLPAIVSRLKALHERKGRVEEELRLYYPSIRNGDSLFPEYETLDFSRPGYERYERVIAEIARLSARLQTNTKFDRLAEWGVANLRYIVAEPAALEAHELPAGWGLLIREGESLQLVVKPIWRDLADEHRFALFQRIALAATRSVNAAHSVTYEEIAGTTDHHYGTKARRTLTATASLAAAEQDKAEGKSSGHNDQEKDARENPEPDSAHRRRTPACRAR